MPLYDFQCEDGHKFERVVSLKDFEVPQFCDCQKPARRLISSPLFSVDKTDYQCPVTGKHISSLREHRENLARTGCRVLETGEKELNEKRRKEADEAFDKKVEDTVEREIDSYSSHKKEQLHNELVNGKLDAVIERR